MCDDSRLNYSVCGGGMRVQICLFIFVCTYIGAKIYNINLLWLYRINVYKIIFFFLQHMKDEFLLLDDFNVIVVDWSLGNTIPYTQAAANTERAGKEIAELMHFLIVCIHLICVF